MKIDTQLLKAKLGTELAILEKELQSVGRRNPDNPADWQPTPAKMNVSPADENEVADTIEEFETRTAELKPLEIRYNEVKKAIEKINADAYGLCEVCNLPIEEDRLM